MSAVYQVIWLRIRQSPAVVLVCALDLVVLAPTVWLPEVGSLRAAVVIFILVVVVVGE